MMRYAMFACPSSSWTIAVTAMRLLIVGASRVAR